MYFDFIIILEQQSLYFHCGSVFFTREGEKTRLLGREVVQLVTPGTLVEPLDNQANYLLSIVPGPGATVGLAWLDVSTAEFCVTSTEVQDIEEDIERICPSEVGLIYYSCRFLRIEVPRLERDTSSHYFVYLSSKHFCISVSPISLCQNFLFGCFRNNSLFIFTFFTEGTASRGCVSSG